MIAFGGIVSVEMGSNEHIEFKNKLIIHAENKSSNNVYLII